MRFLVAIAVTGCGFTGPAANGAHDASVHDGPPDGAVPDPDAVVADGGLVDAMLQGLDGSTGPTCYGRTGYQVCVPVPPSQSIDYMVNTTINTGVIGANNCDLIVGTNPTVCVISRTSITIDPSVTVRAIGPHPIVFGATGAITVSGTIDVASSTAIGLAGAGAGTGSCSTPGTAGASTGGGAGGAGGSFVGSGGNGGNGHGGATGATHGAAATAPTALRGGCAGGPGGEGQPVALVSAGGGGLGGGAVGLYAGSSLTISGYVDASGGGGGPGLPAKGGGGGGGSGGMIVLDGGTSLSVSGLLYANGGGGGGGSGASTPGGFGFETVPGHVVTETGGGTGGFDTPPGGTGGNGATRTAGATNGMNMTDTGAGGGGGSLGAIRVPSGQGASINAANASPAPS